MTYEELLQAMLDRVPSNVDKREGSIIYDALAPCAYFLTQQNFQLDNFVDLVLPDTAEGEYLDRAASAFGVSRKEASAAVREMETSAAVDLGTRWGINDLVYVVLELLGGNKYSAVCETPGEIGNQYSGAMQPVTGGIAGITATLGSILEAGTDRESDESFRERLYQKVRLPSTSGNAYHYKLWALEVAGVGDAKVFPLDNGPGTVTVLVVDDDKRADSGLEDNVSAYLETVRPIGAAVTVGSPSETAINITAKVQLDGSRSKGDVETDFKAAMAEYLRGLVYSEYRVSYARVGSLLLSTQGVHDYNDLTLNGATGNVTIGEKAIPVMGTTVLTEVASLASD